jgi:hypothetical protein
MTAASNLSLFAEILPAEKDAAEFITYCLTQPNTTELADLLVKISPIQFYRLTTLSTEIQEYCSTQSTFDFIWQEKLISNKCPSIVIHSKDAKEHLSPYDLFIGLSFYQSFLTLNVRDVKRVEALNKACDVGLYAALIVRIKTHVSVIKNQGLQPKGEEEFNKLLNDTKRLSNLYWRLGYLQAAYTFRDISNHFYDLHLALIDTDAELILQKAQLFGQLAVHHFLCASFLVEHPTSKEIWQNIPDGKMIDSSIEQQDQMQVWMDNQNAIFLEKLGVELFEKIYIEAQQDVKLIS